MIAFLAMQVRIGRITIEQVPEKYRERVRTALGNGQWKGENHGNDQ